ncbi:MAG: sigma-70 family RNA polymerase sigma factor [Mycobacteriales bacterium]
MRRRPGKGARQSPGFLGMTSAAAIGTAERQRAFHAYVEPEIDVLLRVAQTLTGSWSDSEDLVQDTLIRAYRAIDRFDGAHPRAWLLTILRHTHLNSIRRQRPDLAREGMDLATQRPAFGAARTAASAEETVTDRLLDDDVESAVASLDPRFRTVLLLIDVEQLTYAEAAELLGLPLGTVMSRLSRARDRVRTQLRAQPRLRRQP